MPKPNEVIENWAAQSKPHHYLAIAGLFVVALVGMLLGHKEVTQPALDEAQKIAEQPVCPDGTMLVTDVGSTSATTVEHCVPVTPAQ